MLHCSYMETPTYLVPHGTLWSDWQVTLPARYDDSLKVGTEHERTQWYKDELDRLYPGFCAAFEMLTAMGCDEYFVTDVLKFSILHAQDEQLDAFLERSKTLLSVETALAIGLSGEALAVLLSNHAPAVDAPKLPNDLGIISGT